MFNIPFHKLIFLSGYNYYFRFCNIKRKIEDLDINSNSLQHIINQAYTPPIFQGGKIYKDKVEIGEFKKFNINIADHSLPKSPSDRNFSFESIPLTEKAYYLLITEILADTTQYCSDLVTILKCLGNIKSTTFQLLKVKDKEIKDWYNTLPLINDFLKYFGIPKFESLKLDIRYHMLLKYDEFFWNAKRIGDFYNLHYDFLYTPYRHGMRISIVKDKDGYVFCKTLSTDGKYNFLYLSKSRIEQCEEIITLI